MRANALRALAQARVRCAVPALTRGERRYVDIQFVSGLRARIAEHHVRRWSPRPPDGGAAVPPGSAWRLLVRWQ